jgi:hypothetical protein
MRRDYPITRLVVHGATAAPEIPMGTVEHLKILYCLGLPPESAMIAVVPVLHAIIPQGWSRLSGDNGFICGESGQSPRL